MPQRRALSGALSGAADIMDTLISKRISGQENDRVALRNDMLQRQRQAMEMVAKGDLELKDVPSFISGSYTGPSASQDLDKILTGLKQDPNQTSTTLANKLESRGIPSQGFGAMPSSYQMGIPNFDKPETDAQVIDPNNPPPAAGPQRKPLTPPLASTSMGPVQSPAMAMAQGQRRASIPTTVMGKKQDAEGADTDVYGQRNPDTGLLVPVQESRMGPTNTQRTAQSFATSYGTEAGQTQAASDYSYLGAQTAAEKTKAESMARLPAEEALASFGNWLSGAGKDIQIASDPVTGEDRLVVVDKSRGRNTVSQLQMPGGLKPGKALNLPGMVEQEISGLNNAETVGVQILRGLEATGLDRSNDPFDPRWNQFLVNELRMAPADVRKGIIQQRLGYINAQLTRSLMGARPSQYVAQLLQAHLPQQNMTGMQVARVLRSGVLDQINKKRKETAKLLGVPLERITPAGGESFDEFLQKHGTIPTTPGTGIPLEQFAPTGTGATGGR